MLFYTRNDDYSFCTINMLDLFKASVSEMLTTEKVVNISNKEINNLVKKYLACDVLVFDVDLPDYTKYLVNDYQGIYDLSKVDKRFKTFNRSILYKELESMVSKINEYETLNYLIDIFLLWYKPYIVDLSLPVEFNKFMGTLSYLIGRICGKIGINAFTGMMNDLKKLSLCFDMGTDSDEEITKLLNLLIERSESNKWGTGNLFSFFFEHQGDELYLIKDSSNKELKPNSPNKSDQSFLFTLDGLAKFIVKNKVVGFSYTAYPKSLYSYSGTEHVTTYKTSKGELSCLEGLWYPSNMVDHSNARKDGNLEEIYEDVYLVPLLLRNNLYWFARYLEVLAEKGCSEELAQALSCTCSEYESQFILASWVYNRVHNLKGKNISKSGFRLLEYLTYGSRNLSAEGTFKVSSRFQQKRYELTKFKGVNIISECLKRAGYPINPNDFYESITAQQKNGYLVCEINLFNDKKFISLFKKVLFTLSKDNVFENPVHNALFSRFMGIKKCADGTVNLVYGFKL